MDLFKLPPPARTGLERYRLLSPRAGVHVSPIALGGMNIGSKWVSLGHMDKESSFKLLDAYFENGGNFIDTANLYQDGESEQWIGEWAEKRNIRDKLFIATKYSNNPDIIKVDMKHKILQVGNNTKSLHLSFKRSLQNLRTDYIDLFYLHWWDHDTSVEEVMNSLHNLVIQGKVLYLGISDAPAWVVAKCNQYARDHALTPFIIYQGRWNVMDRSFEREIIAMARDEGMALAPWGVIVGGRLRSDAEEKRREESGEEGRKFTPTGDSLGWKRSEQEKTMTAALEKVANEVGAKNLPSVAIAYVMQKAPFVFPTIGGRKVEQLLANLEALDISLSDEHVKFLESVIPFDPGFPADLIGVGTTYNALMLSSGVVEPKPMAKAVRPDPKDCA